MTESQAFKTALLDPNKPAPANLNDGHGRPANSRFNIYRNNVVTSLIRALETGFPITCALLGSKHFKGLAIQFVRMNLPETPVMPLYGEKFPEFLYHHIPQSADLYVSDVARLEYTIRLSYHSADCDGYDWSTLGLLSEEELSDVQVTFAPAVFLITSDCPLYDMWASSKIDADSTAREAQSVLVVRPEFDPYPVLLPQSSLAFFLDLKGLVSLGLAIERANKVQGFDLQATLQLFAQHQCVKNIARPE